MSQLGVALIIGYTVEASHLQTSTCIRDSSTHNRSHLDLLIHQLSTSFRKDICTHEQKNLRMARRNQVSIEILDH